MVIFVTWESPLFHQNRQGCEGTQNAESYDKNCAADSMALPFGESIGTFLDAHGNAINALSSIAVAIFTGTLWWVTWGLAAFSREQRRDLLRSIEAAEMAAKTAVEQTKLARKEFTATHRPRLFIRRMELTGLYEYEAIRVRYRVVNGGSSPAKITEHWTRIWVYPNLSSTPTSDVNSPVIVNPILAAGEAQFCVTIPVAELRSELEWDISKSILKVDDPSTWRIGFNGRIRYEDDNGVLRETAFHRVYDPQRQRMIPVGDPDFEYTD